MSIFFPFDVIATTDSDSMYLELNTLFKISFIFLSVLFNKIYATYFSFPLSTSLHMKYPSPSSSFWTSFMSALYSSSSCVSSTSTLSSVCSAAYVVTFPLVTSIAPASSIAPSCLTILLFITSS